MHDRLDLLRGITMFRDLPPPELERVASVAAFRTFRKKTVVFHEGDVLEAVYFIRRGMVKTFKTDEEGREHIVSLLGAGEMFPHTALFGASVCPATATALVDTDMAVFALKPFERLLLEAPAVAAHVIRALGEKIRDLQQKLQQLTGFDVRRRIVSFLLHAAETHGRSEGEGVRLNWPLTHQELADMLGTSRETVNRVLSDLRREGHLEFDRQSLVLRRFAEFRKLSDFS